MSRNWGTLPAKPFIELNGEVYQHVPQQYPIPGTTAPPFVCIACRQPAHSDLCLVRGATDDPSRDLFVVCHIACAARDGVEAHPFHLDFVGSAWPVSP